MRVGARSRAVDAGEAGATGGAGRRCRSLPRLRRLDDLLELLNRSEKGGAGVEQMQLQEDRMTAPSRFSGTDCVGDKQVHLGDDRLEMLVVRICGRLGRRRLSAAR